MQARRYEAGEKMICQGQPGDCLYLIVDGAARADVRDHEGQVHSVGEVAGWAGLVDTALLEEKFRQV